MFWVTLWALVLGFAISGAVQAFASRRGMERKLGDHRLRSVTRATGLGMISSSCSYAAAAMAKSLFQKGADFLTSMVFMFASTNLVLELGIVLIVLMGWEFAAAEFIGGPIMIALLVIVGSRFIAKNYLTEASEHLDSTTDEHEHQHSVGEQSAWKTKAGWSDAARYTMADLNMLRRELFLGYLIAGALAVLVPVHVWNDVFLHGHGWVATLENVIIGPVIACISFVCSIGNVPMAAALWFGGISFGGVISFIFADLLSFPLLVIYNKYYGRRLTLRLVGVFWFVMSSAGLIVEVIFSALNLIPERPHEKLPVETMITWNYTTFLNFVAIAGFVVLIWLARNRDRYGGEQRFATDPVCGMQVEIANAPAQESVNGVTYYFCSEHCREKFLVRK
jgi:uncharacterized membrane protein YraQ (UPF0718 family)